MEIREATPKDFEELNKFYEYMCRVLNEKDFLPNGNKGGFPSEEMILEAINSATQFIGVEDGNSVDRKSVV